MTQTLEMIAEAIEKSSQPGWVEYLAIGISLISVVVSGIAILFAVRVADKQNKIALFEKRYGAYWVLSTCIAFGENLRKIDPGDPNADITVYNMFVEYFAKEINGEVNFNGDIDYLLTYIRNSLGKSILLFKLEQKEKIIISQCAQALPAVIRSDFGSTDWCNNAISFSNLTEDLNRNTITKIAKQLKLSE